MSCIHKFDSLKGSVCAFFTRLKIDHKCDKRQRIIEKWMDLNTTCMQEKISLRFCWQAVLSIECKWCSDCLHAIRPAWWRMKCSCQYLTWVEKYSVVIWRSEVSHPSLIHLKWYLLNWSPLMGWFQLDG